MNLAFLTSSLLLHGPFQTQDPSQSLVPTRDIPPTQCSKPKRQTHHICASQVPPSSFSKSSSPLACFSVLPVGVYLGAQDDASRTSHYGAVGHSSLTFRATTVGTVAVLIPYGAYIGECIDFLRDLKGDGANEELLETLYIVKEGGVLCGCVTTGDLVIGDKQVRVENIMRTIGLKIVDGEAIENAARRMKEHRVMYAPLVDQKKKIVGVVSAMDLMRDKFQEEILRLEGVSGPVGGADIDETAYFETSIKSLVQGRASWLIALLLLQSVSSSILSGYSTLIEQNVVLALFLTMLTGTGGNAGNQSLALVIRGLATGDIDSKRDFWRVVAKESKVAVILAGFLSLVSFSRVYVSAGSSDGSLTAAGTVAAALFLTVVAAVVAGTVTPMMFERIGLDPCYFASPALATLTDIGGVLILCSLATLTLKSVN